MDSSSIFLTTLLCLGAVCASPANDQATQYCVIGAGPAGMLLLHSLIYLESCYGQCNNYYADHDWMFPNSPQLHSLAWCVNYTVSSSMGAGGGVAHSYRHLYCIRTSTKFLTHHNHSP